MKCERRGCRPGVEAAVGYAADERGSGLAYARLTGGQVAPLLRVASGSAAAPFRRTRERRYAALTAVARALCQARFTSTSASSSAIAEFAEESRRGRGVADDARDSVRPPPLRAQLACDVRRADRAAPTT